MSYSDKIEALEIEIRALGIEFAELIKSSLGPEYLLSIESDFYCNDYSEALDQLDWHIENQSLILSDTASRLFVKIKSNIRKVKSLYENERRIDGGFKHPVLHMDALMQKGDEIPNRFGKRYGISELAVKGLWLSTPAFEERFIRERIGQAVARNGARTGHYIFAKRRYELTDEQVRRLVDDMWENPNTISNVFHELLDREKLVLCRLTESAQNQVLEVQANFDRESD